jgi:DNA sulfur modification protein DndE
MKTIVFGLLFSYGAVTAQTWPASHPKIESVSFKSDTFSIVAYGAKSDGVTLNTSAINSAITTCHEHGGGTVVVPAGFWLTGPLELKSNVNFHVAEGAVLQFSDNPEDYPLIRTNWEGLEAIRSHPPVYAHDAENIAITGKGILDGAGQAWRPVKKSKLTAGEWKALVSSGGVLNEAKDTWYPTARALKGSLARNPGVVAAGYDVAKATEIREFLRPNMISIARCNRVLLEGVTFQNSPAWCIHPLLTKHLTVRNIFVRNPWNAQNGDGIDIESCRYVLVEGSKFDVGDDGICIKSGRDEEGRKRGVPTEDVIVRNCTVFHGHGGFVVGSEMSGGARNLFVSDCNFLGTDIGLRFKTTRGRGGIVEKIYIENIRMNHIGGAAILFDMYYMAKDPLAAEGDSPAIAFKPVNEGTPQFRDFHIRNVVCQGAGSAVFIRGLPEMNIRDIEMDNLSIESEKGFVCIEGAEITLRNSRLECESPLISVQNSNGLVVDHVNGRSDGLFISIMGTRSKDIRIINSGLIPSDRTVALGTGVDAGVLRLE